MKVRVVKRMSFDSPPKPYFIIQETVTTRGHTIDWPGIYSTREAAMKEVKKSGRVARR